MPSGVRRTWTREELETIEQAEKPSALALELDVSRNTIYSLRSRIRLEGIDAILHKQDHRYETYVRGGGRSRPETVTEQLAKVHNISIANAGRGGAYAQYTITIPRSIGEVWVEQWGKQIRFTPTDEGLLIKPVLPEPPPALPNWLPPQNGSEPK